MRRDERGGRIPHHGRWGTLLVLVTLCITMLALVPAAPCPDAAAVVPRPASTIILHAEVAPAAGQEIAVGRDGTVCPAAVPSQVAVPDRRAVVPKRNARPAPPSPSRLILVWGRRDTRIAPVITGDAARLRDTWTGRYLPAASTRLAMLGVFLL